RPAPRRRSREDAQIHLRDGEVRRPHARPARRQLLDEEGNAQDPEGDSGRQVRASVDRGEQARSEEVRSDDEQGSEAQDRKGRREAARTDALAGRRARLITSHTTTRSQWSHPIRIAY